MTWWVTVLASVIGALVGGSLTGVFTLLAVDKAHDNAMTTQQENQKKLIQGLLQAIHDEIETLWESYQSGVGVYLESLPENHALLYFYPVTQEYFTVYTGNAFLIGHVEDADLRKLIVQVYSKARGLIDSYRMNNDMLGKFEYWDNMHKETNGEVHKQNAFSILAGMQAYAKTLRKAHDELKDLSGQLLRRLRKMGVISEMRR